MTSTGFGDLDERIARAEQAVMARDLRVTQGIDELTRRVRGLAEPKRWLAPAGGLAAALLGLGVLWRQRRASHPQAAHATAPRQGGHSAWLHLLPTLWPMLPAKWRSKVSPTTATAMFSIGLPVIEGVLQRPPPAPLPTVPQVDLARYAGTWYEIARLPEPFEAFCDGQSRATYTPNADGSIAVLNRCPKKDGGERSAHGLARVEGGSGGAKLKVTFLPRWLHWLPFGWADYWVLELADDYSVALVGNPGRNFLWVLARNRRLDPAALRAMLDLARALGFDTDKVKITQPS